MATTQKQVKTRIQQKHDTSANWAKATSFVPLKGEIVVYDDLGRVKVGDGTNTVANLKFVDEGTWLPLAGGTLTGTLKGPMFEDDGSSYMASMALGAGSLSIISEYGSLKYRPDGGIFAKYRGADISITAGAMGDGEVSLTFGSGATYTITNNEIKYLQLTGGGDPITWTFTGISDTKGTDSTVAASLKCLNDNYLPLSGGTLTGTLTATKFTGDASGLTSIPAGKLTGTISIDRLPNLSSKYLSVSGGTLTGQLTLSSNGIKFNTNAIKDVTYSTTDLVAGTSTLATNSIYIVYE